MFHRKRQTPPFPKLSRRKDSPSVTNAHLCPVSEVIEILMWDEKHLFPNADFYSATAYHYNGLSTPLSTPILVMSRITGGTTHVIEERAAGKLIRSTGDYVGSAPAEWVPIEKRCLTALKRQFTSKYCCPSHSSE
ncbi:MAG: citrate/2-methylcitrate synthase [Verrucomicrobiota bacterium]